MKLPRISRILSLVLVAPLFAACGDDTGTELGDNTLDFDAYEVISTAADLVNAVDEGLGASFNISRIALQMGFGEPGADGTIPAEYVGSELVYDLGEQEWVVDEEGTGAPANGVRATWYATDPSGAISVPLNPMGTIDITPAQVAGLDGIHVEVQRVTDGVTLADIDLAIMVPAGGEGMEREVRLEGTYRSTDRESHVEIAMASAVEGGTETYTSELDVTGVDSRFSWRTEGTADLSSQQYDEEMLVEIVDGGTATVLDLDLSGQGTQQLTGGGTLTRSGSLVAEVDLGGNQVAFTAPDGGRFDSSSTVALEDLTYVMLFEPGSFVLAVLPLLQTI